MVATTDQSPIAITGSLARLMSCPQQECLWEGPAGTGKTFGLALAARGLCEFYPGTRGLFIRQTRKSLNTSLLDIWENEVLGYSHPALIPRLKRKSRDEYTFPYAENHVDGRDYRGESRVDLVGMDSPERLMSTQYDWAFFIEATEGFLHAWDLIGSRLRRFYIYRHGRPWSFQVADCNPAHAGHWLNVRAEQAFEPNPEMMAVLGYTEADVDGWTAMARIRTTLKDNPKYWDAKAKRWTPQGAMYNLTLDRMSPVNQKRLRDGLWVSQSGQVYPGFDRNKHVVNGKLIKIPADYGRWRLDPVTGKTRKLDGFLPPDFTSRLVAYFVIGVDWGYSPDPASVGLYAIDDDGHAFRVKGYYETCVSLDEWAKRIVDWQKRYDVRAIICDQPREKVEKLNDLLGHKLNDHGKPIAMVAEKGQGSILAGIETVRWALKDSDHGEPRLRFFSTALENDPDQALLEAHAPTDPVKEFDSYCFSERVETGTNKKVPIDRDNHGMDEIRYISTYLWSNKHSAHAAPIQPQTVYHVSFEQPKKSRRQLIDEARASTRRTYN